MKFVADENFETPSSTGKPVSRHLALRAQVHFC
jgi:hypothetical protein